jgi:GT2 family glycosyltransferase
MSSLPKISVLVVNWNGLRHLQLGLPSLISQHYPSDRLEILLVDNGSVDGSVDYVHRQFPSVRIIRNEHNQGFAKPNNDAARAATGDYVALINNDMRADPHWLSAAAQQLDERRNLVCVGSRILSWDGQRVDFNGGTMQFLGYAAQQDIGCPVAECESAEKEILFPCGGAMLINREVYLAAGGFDEDYFAIYEDVDLGWRLWLMGYRVILAPQSVVYHRLHGTLDRSREEKMRYLMHRNALWTVIKNYADDTLRKVLPMAVVQTLGRAMFFSGADRSSFYLWAGQDAQIASAGTVPDTVVWQCRDAINHLVMLDDTFQALPALRAKRMKVQDQRKVADDAILPRFGDPFRNIMSDLRYELSELDLVQSLGLDQLFSRQQQTARWQHELEGRTTTEAGRLREDIAALERRKKQLELELMQLSSPSRPNVETTVLNRSKKSIPQLLREFVDIQRRQGLAAALQQTLLYLSRPR